MKILQVNKLYFPWVGGMEKIVQQVAEGLNNRDGLEIEVLCCQPKGKKREEGITGVKLGKISKSVAALLRIEASIQDLCVEAILKESKDLALACIASDVNCGSFEMAEAIFNEMSELQKDYLPNFK